MEGGKRIHFISLLFSPLWRSGENHDKPVNSMLANLISTIISYLD